MTLVVFLVGVPAVLLGAQWLDERLNKPGTTYRRLHEWFLGPDLDDQPAQVIELPRNVRVLGHCPFCGAVPPLHDQGCSPLDRLDVPRLKETRP